MPAITIQVAVVTSPDQWSVGAGENKVVAVAEPSDDDTTYILSGASGSGEQYSLAASGIPSGSTINSVSTFGRCKRDAAANGSWQIRIYLGADVSLGTNRVSTDSYVQYTEALARPGGGTWQDADFSSLQIRVRSGSANQTRCTSLWLIVDYTPPANTGLMFLVFP